MKIKKKRINPCSECIVLPMCNNSCTLFTHHDLIIFSSYTKFMQKFSKRQECSPFLGSGLILDYNPKLLKHFLRTADKKIKKNYLFLLEEVEEVLYYRYYIGAKKKPVILKTKYFSMQVLNTGGLLANAPYS